MICKQMNVVCCSNKTLFTKTLFTNIGFDAWAEVCLSLGLEKHSGIMTTTPSNSQAYPVFTMRQTLF